MKKILLCLYFCFLLKTSVAQQDNAKVYPEQSISVSLFKSYSYLNEDPANSFPLMFYPALTSSLGINYEYNVTPYFGIDIGFRYITCGYNWNQFDGWHTSGQSLYNVNIYYSYSSFPVGGRFYFGGKEKSFFLSGEIIPGLYTNGSARFVDSSANEHHQHFYFPQPSNRFIVWDKFGIGKRIKLPYMLYAECGLYYQNSILPFDQGNDYKFYFDDFEFGLTIGRKL